MGLSYAALGGSVYLGILLVLVTYLLLTDTYHNIDIGGFLLRINPFVWAAFGLALCVGLSVVGAGWYLCWHIHHKMASLSHIFFCHCRRVGAFL